MIPYATDSIFIYNDSMAALAIVKDPKYHGNSKHTETGYRQIRGIFAYK